MTGWTTLSAQAVALPLDNIDTDQLIPARFMSAPRSEGYGQFLLHDMGDSAQVLDQHLGAQILIAGRNFGSGSSREAAVYALVDAGFRCVIAPSFGDIFAGNAVNNGLCPAQVADIAPLLAVVHPAAPVQIDLSTGLVRAGDVTLSFTLSDVARRKLVNGWDDIDLTRSLSGKITTFARTRRASARWTWPHHASDA